MVLVSVFLPVAFQKGQTGRLFYEFGVTLAVSVLVSAFVALTLTPALCAILLKPSHEEAPLFRPFAPGDAPPIYAMWRPRRS